MPGAVTAPSRRAAARCPASRARSGPRPRWRRVSRYARWRAQPVGEFVVPDGIDADAAESVGRRLEGDRPRVRSPTTRRWRCCAATASRSPRSGGPAMPTPWRRRRSSAFRWWSRRPTTGGATAATSRECGSTSPARRPSGRGLRRRGPRSPAAATCTCSGCCARGVSCVIEIVEDPSFGSLLSFGLSGMATELLGDRAFRVVPMSDQDAAALVRAPRAAPLLAGYRGSEPAGPRGAGGAGAAGRPDRRGPAGGADARARPGAGRAGGCVRLGGPDRGRPARRGATTPAPASSGDGPGAWRARGGSASGVITASSASAISLAELGGGPRPAGSVPLVGPVHRAQAHVHVDLRRHAEPHVGVRARGGVRARRRTTSSNARLRAQQLLGQLGRAARAPPRSRP